MSRSSKRRRKQQQEKRRRRNRAARRTQEPRTIGVVNGAARLMGRGRWRDARHILEEHDAAHPGQKDVLQLLLDVYHQLREYPLYNLNCRRLLEKDPENRSLHLMLAAGYLSDSRVASALRAFRRFVDLWPEDPMADGAREMVAQLEPAVVELLGDSPFEETEKVELAAMHEEMLASMACGEDARAIEIGEALLSRCANFIPGMNNLSQALFQSGRSDEAIALSRRVLDRQPDNVHALANLTRYLLLSGQHEEADSMCRQVRSVRADKPECWCKKAETLSLFGDDQGVLGVLYDAERGGCTQWKTPDIALLYHLAAVAFARQGDHSQAKGYWRKAIEILPGLRQAEDNLAEANKPVADRHGPWPYSFDHWVRKTTIEELKELLGSRLHRKDDKAVERTTLDFAKKHPEVASLVPQLLDRGDEAARQFAWQFAMMVATAEMHEALRVFCLSQRGPDVMRIKTANYLCRMGVLASGRIRMWVKGRWEDIEMFGFEISDEPVSPGHSDQVADWAYEALQALCCDDGKRAEDLLRMCLDVEGDKPDLLNNLAMAYQMQNKSKEAHRLIRHIHERWPDYFFGRVAMANLATRRGHYEQAEAYLAPLRCRPRLHTTEFRALCVAYIQLCLARHRRDAARTWLEMWRNVEPENPDLDEYEERIEDGGRLSLLSKWLQDRLR